MADITTAQAGNWSNTATWTGGALPGTSDVAVLNHAVTLDQDATVAGVTNANTSKLTIGAGKVLTSTGNITLVMAYDGAVVKSLLELGAGAVVELDPPTSTTLTLAIGGAGYGTRNTVWSAVGNSGAWCEVRKKVGAAGTAKITCNAVSLAYTRLIRLGSASVRSLEANSNFVSIQSAGMIFDHVEVADSGEVYCTALDADSPPFEADAMRFSGSLATNSLQIFGAPATITTTDRHIADCAFDKKVVVVPPGKFVIERNMFGGDLDLRQGAGSGKADVLDDNLIWVSVSSDRNIMGEVSCDGNYFLHTHDADNPHFAIVKSARITNSVFEAENVGTTALVDPGDCVEHPPAGTLITGNLILPIEAGPRAGEASGVLCVVDHPSGDGLVIERNTVVGKWGHINIAESTNAVYAGMIASFKRNIFTCASGTSYKANQFVLNNATEDVIAAIDCDYNAGVGLTAGTKGKGYNLPLTGTPGEHDLVDVDPQFLAPTRNVRTWGAARASTDGTLAGARAALLADPSKVADLHSWVRAGFAPQNQSYDVAGAGGWIGAIDGPAAGGATTYTLTGSDSGEIKTAVVLTLTPDGPFTGTVALSDGLSGGLAGTFDPASLSWAAESDAKTTSYTPRFAGAVAIVGDSDGALTDPAALDFTALPKTGAGWVPYPSTAPEYVADADFAQPDLGGLAFFRDANGDPVGPYGELLKPILDAAPAAYSATVVSNCLAGVPLMPEGCFGNSTGAAAPYLATGVPYNVADATSDPETAFVVDHGPGGVGNPPYPTISDPGAFKVPANAAVQGVSGVTPTTSEQALATAYPGVDNDSHLSVFLRDATGAIRWLVETYHSYKDPVESGVWHVAQVTFTDLLTGGGGCRAATPLYESMTEYTTASPSSNAAAVCTDGQARPTGWSGSEAAGIPIIPFCGRFDEFEKAQAIGPDEPIPHALRMTFQNYTQIQSGVAWSYPATATGLYTGYYAYDQDKLIYGQRGKLNKAWWLANRAKYPPFARTLLATLATYGWFVADGGTKLAPTFVIDSRWPWDDDLALLRYGGSYGGETLDAVTGDLFEVMAPIPYFLLSLDPATTTHDLTALTFTPMTLTFQVNPAAVGARWATANDANKYYVSSVAGTIEGTDHYDPATSFDANDSKAQTRTVTYLDPGHLSYQSLADGAIGLRGTSGGLFAPATFTVSAINDPNTATTYTLTAASPLALGKANPVAVRLPAGATLPAPVTVTLSDGGAGGSFDPATVTLSTAEPEAQAEYTPPFPTSVTLGATNDGGLADPDGKACSLGGSAMIIFG